ncbi:hypothetical protein L208DRAFT_1284520, partial [Tricholoma matsutake]
ILAIGKGILRVFSSDFPLLGVPPIPVICSIILTLDFPLLEAEVTLIKTSNLTGQDSFLPTQTSENISRPLIHYLVTICPIKVMFCCVVWGDKVAAIYDMYLYVSQGHHIGSRENLELLGAFSRCECGADIPLNRCCQLSAMIARESWRSTLSDIYPLE